MVEALNETASIQFANEALIGDVLESQFCFSRAGGGHNLLERVSQSDRQNQKVPAASFLCPMVPTCTAKRYLL
jgi:hypothetical protein